MSLATDLAPIVVIPDQARRGMGGRPALYLVQPYEPSTVPQREVVVDAPAVRLTVRGRRLTAALAGVVALTLIAVAHASAPAPTLRPRPVPVGTVQVVQPGDTLWSIAAGSGAGRDPRAEVDRLMALNHLHSSAVTAGQVLRLR
jgi:LysM repeat protein